MFFFILSLDVIFYLKNLLRKNQHSLILWHCAVKSYLQGCYSEVMLNMSCLWVYWHDLLNLPLNSQFLVGGLLDINDNFLVHSCPQLEALLVLVLCYGTEYEIRKAKRSFDKIEINVEKAQWKELCSRYSVIFAVEQQRVISDHTLMGQIVYVRQILEEKHYHAVSICDSN